MYDLKNTTALVKSILEQDERCRNSDSLLYLEVLFAVADKKGIPLSFMTVPMFLLDHHGTNFPPFESVRRARQKVQEHNPHLAACGAVKGFRAENEAEVRAYVAGDV